MSLLLMFSSRRHRRSHIDIWPGFVDALATLLMVIIFVLMTFVVSQLYLTDALNGREETIAHLNQRIATLLGHLEDEKGQHHLSKEKIATFEKTLAELSEQLAALHAQFHTTAQHKEETERKNLSLTEQITGLSEELNRLHLLLNTSEQDKRDRDKTIQTLDETLTQKIAELKKLTEKLYQKDGTGIGIYRSEFFGKLQEAMGKRSDVRVVGDRFVFQSEVLFDQASAELGAEGKKKLDQLAKALKEIAVKIPVSVAWVLRVDGHTDRLPIHNSHYASNWELSAARAISVVKYLIEKGIAPQHLVAAGFGEHYGLPHEKAVTPDTLAKDRRIEFKLDQR